MIKNDFNYKWSKLFAAKRFNTNGNIILTPIEQQELLDDCDKLVKKLNTEDVGNGRELLNSFLNWHDTTLGVKANKNSNKKFIEEYLKTIL